ncbi:hypothetical protein HW132_35660 [Brasilonema sp. CT11]|nr:hypothetical protein [Brasilonema sp. CT11]
MQLYHDVLYAALFHNGFLTNNYETDIKKINATFVPIFAVQQQGIGSATKLLHRIIDWWMLKFITSSEAKQFTEVSISQLKFNN